MHTIGSFVIPKRFVYLCACVYIYKSITATTNNSWQPGISFYIYIYIYIYIHIQPIRGLYKHVYIYIRPISISLVSARRHGEYIIRPSLKCWKKNQTKTTSQTHRLTPGCLLCYWLVHRKTPVNRGANFASSPESSCPDLWQWFGR